MPISVRHRILAAAFMIASAGGKIEGTNCVFLQTEQHGML